MIQLMLYYCRLNNAINFEALKKKKLLIKDNFFFFK